MDDGKAQEVKERGADVTAPAVAPHAPANAEAGGAASPGCVSLETVSLASGPGAAVVDGAGERPRPPSVAEGGTPVDNSALSEEELDQLTQDIVKALKTVYDPEIPSDIYELGLIYNIDVADDRMVNILMTLTAPGCPVAGEMPIWVENAVNSVPGISGCTVTLTFDPPWEQARMSDEARLALNMF